MSVPTAFQRVLFVAMSLQSLHAVGYAAIPIDEIQIPTNAHNVHRQSAVGSSTKEISYQIELPYPQSAVSGEVMAKFELEGWAKCSGYQVGWNSYVDASHGSGHEKTVFQNVSYWTKGDELLMIAMIYYGPVTPQGSPATVPDNTHQSVAITEDHGTAVIKKALKLRCPK